jgi:RNA polymerase sigma-70 factor (ECF subfamily)
MPAMAADDDTALTRRAVEAVARDSYGRLLSFLAARCRDVALAEDALGDAFLAALRSWPERGLPARPEAWLLAAARNRLIDQVRHERVRTEHAQAFALAAKDAEAAASSDAEFPDERLKLLFLCADPAIHPDVHTPLMLQVVLGLDAATIAAAFLVSPAAMSQRLVRAKAKIRDAGMAFDLPPARELPHRIGAVTEAIYAAYWRGWEDVTGADPKHNGLAEEAVWLARVLVKLMPGEPEARGLLALMLHCEARRGARRSADGRYVPLSEQDVRLWRTEMVEEAERELAAAAAQQRAGRFQLEAAIQSVHAERARTGRIEWEAIARLYEGLVRIAPTLGAAVGRAAAVAEVQGPEAGMILLGQIDGSAVVSHQPYWAVRAHLFARLRRGPEAVEAYDRAIGLSEDDAVRRFLLDRRSEACVEA